MDVRKKWEEKKLKRENRASDSADRQDEAGRHKRDKVQSIQEKIDVTDYEKLHDLDRYISELNSCLMAEFWMKFNSANFNYETITESNATYVQRVFTVGSDYKLHLGYNPLTKQYGYRLEYKHCPEKYVEPSGVSPYEKGRFIKGAAVWETSKIVSFDTKEKLMDAAIRDVSAAYQNIAKNTKKRFTKIFAAVAVSGGLIFAASMAFADDGLDHDKVVNFDRIEQLDL